jgi:hypothetical protein
MPRSMPQYTSAFRHRVLNSLELAEAGELAALSSARAEWHIARVEYLYELAFLRLFVEWEIFLEQTFLRYLCGYRSIHGLYAPTSGSYCTSITAAQGLIFGRNGFALWHSPITVINRSRRNLTLCAHEVVIASNTARLENFAAVRHRVAHGQDEAKQKFNSATMALCGRRYRGGRPGRFLRDWDRSVTPNRRWLDTIGQELVGLARQIG